ncbi:P-loop containing nucleoside triphosphate hydrolase protein [Vararia minispora EC-137]|uniref:P-loop containing nucleoside triphosphate hydrolase protein n=1 Tax=Vararia minispora EC-137 TaxID=1314806 RepID=A0ACB8QRF8_9AGAM|nr:P-loop containing nucleoside triphosphate hydrolase protein [Vararia minispora EC-137]
MRYVLQESAAFDEPTRISAAAIVVRRIFDQKGQYTHTVVDITSQALCKVLKEINEGVEGIADFTKYPAQTTLEQLYHSRLGLDARLQKELANDIADGELVADLRAAFRLLEEDLSGTVDNFDQLHAAGEITYELLGMLFVPNTPIYQYHLLTEQHKVLQFRSLKFSVSQTGDKFVELSCRIATYNGRAFGYGLETIIIPAFDGVCKIRELMAYPLDCHEDEEGIRTAAISRGKKYAALGETSHTQISGRAVRYVQDGTRGFWASGRMMVDPLSFGLNVTFPVAKLHNMEIKIPLDRDSLTDELYMICNPVIFGFCFGIKVWGGFAMDRIQDVVHVKEPFQLLVLGEKQKTLVHALVRQHTARAAVFDDIVRGKGKGLVGLLAGPPGSGKTLTAEAVAEVTQKPLYSVSASELAGDSGTVDRKLEMILGLAKKWDAVLLLDEAEVFLQQRDVNNVWRNTLVGVFLRQLEYYEGIMIMTTNLIGHIDEAFESRLHFCINYPELDVASRRTIWGMFFHRASATVTDADLDRLAEQNLNGRQIKNAVISAQSIAMDMDVPLTMGHVDVVLEVFNDWTAARQVQAKK